MTFFLLLRKTKIKLSFTKTIICCLVLLFKSFSKAHPFFKIVCWVAHSRDSFIYLNNTIKIGGLNLCGKLFAFFSNNLPYNMLLVDNVIYLQQIDTLHLNYYTRYAKKKKFRILK